MYAGGFVFDGVDAARFTVDAFCTEWHVEDAYDTLVQVLASKWISEMLSQSQYRDPAEVTMKHYLIYVDDAGAFEFLAADFRQLTPERV